MKQPFHAATKALTAFLFTSCLFLTQYARAVSVSISQLSLNLDSGFVPYSDWGSIDVTFTGSSVVQYFNLAINNTWQIQNIPVLSFEGPGVSQSIGYNFAIGVLGNPVNSVNYGVSLSPSLGIQPASSLSTGVNSLTLNQFSSEGFIPITYGPASPLVGAFNNILASGKSQPGYPNQECGINECVPVSISNSLQYLNKEFQLGLNNADLTTQKMKNATGWGPGGAPIGWWEKKDKYMKDNNLPISTTVITDFSKAIDALTNKYDVELGGGGHRASVVGIADLGNGRYSIDIAHDTNQGVAGGTKVETVTYDSTTGKLNGATYFNNASFRNFVVETPAVPGPLPLLGLGAAFSYSRKLRKLSRHLNCNK